MPLTETCSCSQLYSMLVFSQRSCFLGPRQLVIQKVNVLYHTLHSKRNLKCQKWPAVKNWTWVLTFRGCLYRIWLHFKILATLQFFLKIRTTRWERFYAKFASAINSAQTEKTHSFELEKQIWKKKSVNTGFTNIPLRLAKGQNKFFYQQKNLTDFCPST